MSAVPRLTPGERRSLQREVTRRFHRLGLRGDIVYVDSAGETWKLAPSRRKEHAPR